MGAFQRVTYFINELPQYRLMPPPEWYEVDTCNIGDDGWPLVLTDAFLEEIVREVAKIQRVLPSEYTTSVIRRLVREVRGLREELRRHEGGTIDRPFAD